MSNAPEMSLYDLMDEEDMLLDDGLVLLTIRNGHGFVRSDTGLPVKVTEIKRGGVFRLPRSWERENLTPYRVHGIARSQQPREGADFYLPICEGDKVVAIQYHKGVA